MLNDLQCEEVMDVISYCFPADSVMTLHLTKLYRERDIQFHWDLMDINYHQGNDRILRNTLREMF
jgi:hypothetical protein